MALAGAVLGLASGCAADADDAPELLADDARIATSGGGGTEAGAAEESELAVGPDGPAGTRGAGSEEPELAPDARGPELVGPVGPDGRAVRLAPARALVREEPVRGRNVVLTFDDGPGVSAEEDDLLTLLAAEGVRAILFPTGRWLAERPDWVARAAQTGQLVCNHTYQHKDLRALPDALLREQLTRGAGHGTCDLLRPPYGGFDGRVARHARDLGYRILLWDVDSRDWEGASPLSIHDRVMGRARAGSVVLFHIQARNTLTALPAIIRELRLAGYVLSYDPDDVAPEPFVLRTFVSAGLRPFAFAAGPTYLPGGAGWWLPVRAGAG
ncbi:MAG: polysaccharide deacetylase family protein [Myxococcales bacterium]|nr:polysaccharide deacetylase family protein [Myxococcales bacterium]